jgi:hypothetical protein
MYIHTDIQIFGVKQSATRQKKTIADSDGLNRVGRIVAPALQLGYHIRSFTGLLDAR